MTPRSLVPSPQSVPFENLRQGHLYRFTLRQPPCEKLKHVRLQFQAVFFRMESLGRGKELTLIVVFPGGDWTRIGRSQIVMIEEVR